MKLSSKTKDVDSFVNKLRTEGQDVTTSTTKSKQSANIAKTTTPANKTEV